MKIKSRPSLRFEIKEVTEQGTFEGLLSPYGNVDHGRDVVERGAYTKTLKERGNKIPMLWSHKTDVPIGELALEDREDGLWCKGRFILDLAAAKEAYICVKNGIATGLSIGFETIKDSIEDGVRHLKEVRLYEGSVVLFPMNDLARIATVKSAGEKKGDFTEELAIIQTDDARYQLRYAHSRALDSLFWNKLTREEILSLAATILQQYADATLAWLPDYIAMMEEYYGPVETWSKDARETKAGAAISAANREKLQSIIDICTALLGDKAGTATLETKAAEPEPEPAVDHSALHGLVDQFDAVLKQ